MSQQKTPLSGSFSSKARSEYGLDRAAVFLFDEVLDFFACERFHELLEFRTVFITFTDSYDIRIRGVGAFAIDGTLRIKLCFEGEVHIDDRDIRILQGTRKLRGFQFGEFQVLRVLCDILRGRGDRSAFLQFDETSRLEDEEGTAAIGRIVRNGYMRTVSKIIQRLQLLGIHAHRFEMDSSQGSQLQAFGFAEFIQIWFMLEEVRIEALIRKGQVRLDIIGEFDHFDLDAFFGELVFHRTNDLSVRYRGYADLDAEDAAFWSPQPAMMPQDARSAADTRMAFLKFIGIPPDGKREARLCAARI